MNLSQRQAVSPGGESGAGGTLGSAANAGPAHPMTVGAVGFGPAWTMEDSMAASIVRLEQEADELRAEVALLREERAILQRKFAGVIEGGTNAAVPLPFGEHGRPSDLSLRTNLSGGGERLNPRIPGSEPGAVRREARSVDEGREAEAPHDSRSRVRPAQPLDTVREKAGK